MLVLLLPLPPSSAIRASCLVRPRRSEKMLSERRRAIRKQRTLLAAGGQGRHTGGGGVFTDTPTVSPLLRCRSSTKEQPSGDQQAGRSAAHRAVTFAASAYHSAHTMILETFSHLEHAPVLPESLAVCGNFTSVKIKCSCPGGRKKNLTQDFDATFIYLF